MAMIEILQWAVELLEALAERGPAKPMTFSEVQASHGDGVTRNAMKTRLQSLCEAGWLHETPGGYVPHPRMGRLWLRMNRGFVSGIHEAASVMQSYEP